MTGHDDSSDGGRSSCPGCRLFLPDAAGPTPEEHVASAACWAVYGQVLARSYTDPGYRAVHQMVVDAYAAQHAGGTSRRQVQTAALCLMTLWLFVEDDMDPTEGPALVAGASPAAGLDECRGRTRRRERGSTVGWCATGARRSGRHGLPITPPSAWNAQTLGGPS